MSEATAPIAPLDAREVEVWDLETDVAVVGLGIAGTCAAIAAFEAGARVLAFERAGAPGGTSALKINQEDVTWDKLQGRLEEIYKTRAEKIMFVKGDPEVKYQDVIFAMDAARGGGVKVIGMTPKDNGGGGAPAAKKRK